MSIRGSHLAAARLIQDAGGELVGRTRLQKIAFLLEIAGFGDGFSFEYRHYGPFSEDLAQAIEIAAALGKVLEEEKVADWGGKYSIYRINADVFERNRTRELFVQTSKNIDAIELELAATAAYIYMFENGIRFNDMNPWQETKNRKPAKASEVRLKRAAAAYDELRRFVPDAKLPVLPPP
jgi:uncharacterized protein YwgA